MEDMFMRLVVRERLDEAEAAAAGAAARRAWGEGARRRLWLPFPAPVDSRGMRGVLSTELRAGGARTLGVAGLVAVATGVVALLATLCR